MSSSRVTNEHRASRFWAHADAVLIHETGGMARRRFCGKMVNCFSALVAIDRPANRTPGYRRGQNYGMLRDTPLKP